MTNPTHTFQHLGRSFQEKVVQAMIMDHTWASGFKELFSGQIDECLEYADLKVLSNKYISYHDKYKEFPTLKLLIDISKEELKAVVDAPLMNKMVDFLQRTERNKDLGDLG